MPVVEVIGDEEVLEYIKNIPEALFPAAKESFTATATEAHRKVQLRILDGAGNSLHSRTSQLRRSMKLEVRGTNLKTLGASVFSDSRFASYAPTHEFGATIKAKNKYLRVPGGPYLNIPLPANKTPSGVMRMSARDVFSQGGFLMKSKLHNWLVMMPIETAPLSQREFEEAAGEGIDAIPMFVLKKRVKIAARLRMRETVSNEIPSLLASLRETLREALQ